MTGSHNLLEEITIEGSHNLLEEFTIEQLLWLLCMPACVLYMESVLVSAVELLGDFGLWL